MAIFKTPEPGFFRFPELIIPPARLAFRGRAEKIRIGQVYAIYLLTMVCKAGKLLNFTPLGKEQESELCQL